LRDVDGRNILIVRGQTGRPLLGDTLAARGARVDYLAVYDRRVATHAEATLASVRTALAASAIDFAVVMSVESLDALITLLGDDNLGLLRQTTLVTPAARVIQTARDRLSSIQCILANDPRADGIVDAIRDFVAAGSDPAEKNQ